MQLSLSQFYYFWLVPSVASFILSFLMALNIFLIPELRSRIYQQFLVLLAITDLIKTGSWFLGPKYTSSYEICSTQEYVFQCGSLAQALVASMICSVAYSTVNYRQVPSTRRLLLHCALLSIILVASVALNIKYRSSRLFCCHEYSGFYEDHFKTELYVYSFANLFPILATVILNLFTYFAISNRFRKMNVVLNLRESEAPLHVLVYRLRAYPIIYSSCYMPLLVMYLFATSTGEFSLELGSVAALCVSSLGSAVSINYFYHQKTLAPIVESVVYFWRPLYSMTAQEVARNVEVPLGYTYSDDRRYGNALTEALFSSTDGENEQVTVTRYFPSIDGTLATGGLETITSGNRRRHDDEYLLTVD